VPRYPAYDFQGLLTGRDAMVGLGKRHRKAQLRGFVLQYFLFPLRYHFLEAVNGVLASLKSLLAMRGGYGNNQGDFSYAQPAQAVTNGYVIQLPPGTDFIRDALQLTLCQVTSGDIVFQVESFRASGRQISNGTYEGDNRSVRMLTHPVDANLRMYRTLSYLNQFTLALVLARVTGTSLRPKGMPLPVLVPTSPGRKKSLPVSLFSAFL